MDNRGSDTERNGSASKAAKADVHTRCRVAADRRRRLKDNSHVALNTTVPLNATPSPSENQCDIYLPSFLAFSIMAAMRSSSSSVSRLADTSSSAATTWSGESWKNVSIRCFTAERLAFSRPSAGT